MDIPTIQRRALPPAPGRYSTRPSRSQCERGPSGPLDLDRYAKITEW
jgi:hypothetical protein